MMSSGEVPSFKEPTAFGQAAQHLFQVLSNPFQTGFEPQGYQASFELGVSDDSKAMTSRMLMGKVQDQTKGRTLRKGGVWHLELGYSSLDDRVGISGLSLPLHSPNQSEELYLRRLDTNRGGRLIALYKPHKGEPIQICDEDQQAVFWSQAETTRMLADAGYRLPETSNEPRDMQLAIAKLHDRAHDWERRDERVVPGDMQTHYEIAREHKKSPDRSNSRYDTVLSAAKIEQPYELDEKRVEEVTFSAVNYLVHGVRVVEKIYQRSTEFQEIMTDESWQIIHKQPRRPTVRLLKKLSDNYIEVLGLS